MSADANHFTATVTPADCKPTRPALRWHGGKWRLAPWIISHFPPHRIYVEPYGGAASVLLRKPRAYAEIYNDLDDGAVGLFKILRDGRAPELLELLAYTPFARAEFVDAYQPTDNPLEAARRLLIRSFMGFGSDGHNPRVRTGFRASSFRSGTTAAQDWNNFPAALALVAKRLKGVVIEQRPALTVAKTHDSPETLHYFDPPYLPATRSQKGRKGGGGKYHAYQHEMSTADHAEMLAAVTQLSGMAVVSGYAAPLYDEALIGWRRVEKQTHADGARPRTECLWINPAAQAAMAKVD